MHFSVRMWVAALLGSSNYMFQYGGGGDLCFVWPIMTSAAHPVNKISAYVSVTIIGLRSCVRFHVRYVVKT
jgi:hypothetical protein